MAADGRVNSSSAISVDENGSLILPSLLETRNLKRNKSKFSWSGTFEELIDFALKHLDIKRETAKLSESEHKKTIKAEHLILNWFDSTGTLQLQGSQAAAYKALLNQLLAAETEREILDSGQTEDAGSSTVLEEDGEDAGSSTVLEETDAVSPDDLRKEHFPAEVVLTSTFAKELDKIWAEINSLHNSFTMIDQSNQGDVNNIQLINTLRQENKDLSEEICMLKVQLQEDNNMLKKITEERDSYRKALQIMTKELNTANSTREEQQRQRSTLYPNEEAHQEKPDDIHSDETASDNGNENEGLEREWNEVRRTPKPIQEIDTLIVGDSMIKDIKPSLMSASNTIRKQCLRGAKIEDCTSEVDFSRYKCNKAVIIHLGTNNITTDDSPKTIASKIAEVGKEIQRKTQAPRIIISGIISRNDKRVGSKIVDTNNELRSMCVQMKWRFVNNDRLNESCLNGSKLHLNNKGSAYLATNFLKVLNTSTASKHNTRDARRPKDNDQNFRKTKALLASLIQGLL